jgi:RNA polymerase sigma-70 factor (ECF subfamily)
LSSSPLYNEHDELRSIAAGDEAAFARLFNHYRNKIYSIGLKLSRSVIVAEEIVQDVFVKIWVKRQALQEINDFESYLFIVVRNEVYQVLQRMARQRRHLYQAGKQIDTVHNDTEQTVYSREYISLLQQAISRLPPQQKLVYEMMKEQGLKREEVASRLRLNPETVKTHLAQATRNIRAFCHAHMDLYILLLLLPLKK